MHLVFGMRWGMSLVLAAAAFLPARAEAFSRTRDPDKGLCLYWPERTVTFHVNENCSADIELAEREACFQAVRDSFQVWTDPTCSDFEFVDGGLTAQHEVGFDSIQPENNLNLVVWRESNWEHDSSAIALTTTFYDTETGIIVDADIELNGVVFTFSCGGSPQSETDIQNTLVHEAGHILGLDHSTDPIASMYSYTSPGEIIKRSLSEDDRQAVCFVYPSEESTPNTYPEDDQLKVCGNQDPEEGGGCDCGPTEGPNLQVLWILPLLLVWLRRLGTGLNQD